MPKDALKWYRIAIAPDDDFGQITRKLQLKQPDSSLYPNSVYVVRIAKGFILEYKNQRYSPVVYIGQGKLRGRLTAHQTWLGKLSTLLHNAPLEVSFCFPRSNVDAPLNKAFEAHLLRRFKDLYGRLPINNKRVEPLDNETDFAKKLSGQVFSHGSGKSYLWSIRPHKSNSFGERKPR